MNFRWSYDATSELIEVICIIWKALWRLISPLLYQRLWHGQVVHFPWLPDTLNFGSLPFPTPIPKTLLEAWGHSLDRFIFLLPALSPGFSWVVKIPCRKEKLSTPVFRPREFHALYGPWGRKELDMTEWFFTFTFKPWIRKILWSRKWQPTPVFLPEKSHGQRSLVRYSPWGHKNWTLLSARAHTGTPCRRCSARICGWIKEHNIYMFVLFPPQLSTVVHQLLSNI